MLYPYSITIPAPTTSITLNTAAPLVLLGAVVAQNGTRFPASSTTYDDKKELTTLTVDAELAAGEAVLGFRWEGSLDAGSMLGARGTSVETALADPQGEQGTIAFPDLRQRRREQRPSTTPSLRCSRQWLAELS